MDDDVTRAWLAGAQAARASDVVACERYAEVWRAFNAGLRQTPEDTAASALAAERLGATYALRDIIRDAPLPAPPAPAQSPLPSPDGGTGPRGDGAPAGGRGVAEAYVEAAGVCERMAQAHDRLAAAADSEGAERRQREAAGVLRCAADRIRALAGGP